MEIGVELHNISMAVHAAGAVAQRGHKAALDRGREGGLKTLGCTEEVKSFYVFWIAFEAGLG